MARSDTTTPATATEAPEAPTATETTTAAHPLLAERDAKIAAWLEADQALATAQAEERSAPKPSAARATARKARLSWGAKKANRIAEIRQLELDLRLEGVEHTPYDAPVRASSDSHRLQMTQQELEDKLAKVRALHATLRPGSDDAVIHSCEVRIKGLLKSAEQRGYQVS